MSAASPSSNASVQEILEKLSDTEASTASDTVEEEEGSELQAEVESEAVEEQESASQKRGLSKGRKKNYIPEDRFKEVIEDKNYYKKQLELAVEREQKLTEDLKRFEKELSVLERIRQAAFDDKVGKHVLALDKWLRGEPIEDAVQAAEEELKQETSEGKKGLSEEKLELLKNQLGSKVSELESELQEQRAAMILDRADALAAKMLQSLDESYAEEDLRTISELWTPRVDWDAIEENPDILQEELNRSFREVLDLYGVPRGKLLESSLSSTVSSSSEEDDPESFLQKALNTDWGKTDGKGKPVVSDDEFSRVMAEVLRKSRNLSE